MTDARKQRATYVLPWPPSVNRYWRSINGRAILSAEGRKYRTDAVAAILSQGRERFGDARIWVYLDVSPPDRRRRDLDNLAKGLLDALGHAGVYDDDGQIDELRIRRCDGRERGVVTVTIGTV